MLLRPSADYNQDNYDLYVTSNRLNTVSRFNSVAIGLKTLTEKNIFVTHLPQQWALLVHCSSHSIPATREEIRLPSISNIRSKKKNNERGGWDHIAFFIQRLLIDNPSALFNQLDKWIKELQALEIFPVFYSINMPLNECKHARNAVRKINANFENMFWKNWVVIFTVWIMICMQCFCKKFDEFYCS